MPIAVTDEHLELSRVARAFLAHHGARAAARALLEAPDEGLPSFWKPLTDLGWTGLHLSEAHGGQGFGLPELAVVLEALGHAVAPGPFLPTVWTSAVIDATGDSGQKRALLPGLADGSVIGAVGLGGSLTRAGDGSLSGSAGLVLGAGLADLLLLAVGGDLVIVEREQQGVEIRARANVDPSRRVAELTLSGVRVDPTRVLAGARGAALRLGRTLAAAEAAGGAQACAEMATEYAKVRQQFGRPIGTFQAVKHHCANMLVDAEQATAAAWDAARAGNEGDQAELASAVAASVALPAFARCCQLNVQVHGGIGYTWEHDLHLWLKRAKAGDPLLGSAAEQRARLARRLGLLAA
jgi:hypothetical protein